MTKRKRLSREQEKAIFAQMGPKAQAAWQMLRYSGRFYHGAKKRIYSIDPEHEKTFHIGTKKAAIARLSSGRALRKRTKWLHEVQVPKNARVLVVNKTTKTWGLQRPGTPNILSDDDANWRTGSYNRKMFQLFQGPHYQPRFRGKSNFYIHRWQSKVRERLKKRGYDLVAYKNDVEDPGSISFILLSPEKAKIKPIRRLIYSGNPHTHGFQIQKYPPKKKKHG